MISVKVHDLWTYAPVSALGNAVFHVFGTEERARNETYGGKYADSPGLDIL